MGRIDFFFFFSAAFFFSREAQEDLDDGTTPGVNDEPESTQKPERETPTSTPRKSKANET